MPKQGRKYLTQGKGVSGRHATPRPSGSRSASPAPPSPKADESGSSSARATATGEKRRSTTETADRREGRSAERTPEGQPRHRTPSPPAGSAKKRDHKATPPAMKTNAEPPAAVAAGKLPRKRRPAATTAPPLGPGGYAKMQDPTNNPWLSAGGCSIITAATAAAGAAAARAPPPPSSARPAATRGTPAPKPRGHRQAGAWPSKQAQRVAHSEYVRAWRAAQSALAAANSKLMTSLSRWHIPLEELLMAEYALRAEPAAHGSMRYHFLNEMRSCGHTKFAAPCTGVLELPELAKALRAHRPARELLVARLEAAKKTYAENYTGAHRMGKVLPAATAAAAHHHHHHCTDASPLATRRARWM